MKIFFIVLAAIIVLLLALCTYFGGFKTINFTIEEQGGEMFVYEAVIGSYKQTPDVMSKVYHALTKAKIATTKGAGTYYDNPRELPEDKLRSEIGCIVDNPDMTTLAAIQGTYLIKTFDTTAYVVTEFPYKGKLSVIFGIMKVYPALEKYCNNKRIGNSPITEIYDMPNKKIIYRKELIKK